MIHNYSTEEAVRSCPNECVDVLITANPPSGAPISFPSFVVLSANVSGAVIHYTTNGTEPTLASPIYTEPIQVTSPNFGIRARAFIDGCPPGPIANIQYSNTSFPLVFSYACDTPDNAGQWDDFTPNGTTDHHWQLQFTLSGATTIKRLELYQLDGDGNWTTGQVWSTDSPINPVELEDEFGVFPLLLFIAAVQQHTDYQSSLGSFGAGTHTWDLYGDTVIAAGGLFRIDIFLGDDTKLSQTVTGETCVSTPPICPPPATPTVTGKCDGKIDVTFSGTVGRDYIIYKKSDICSSEGWEEAASGTIDASPKTVEVSGLVDGCLYQFYVSIDEAGCGFRDSSPSATAAPLFDPIVSIATNKTIVDPNESFTISWNSQHIGTAVCGGCLAGQVLIDNGIGCKAGNTSGSQGQSQATCGTYTYQISGCNTCGTAIASVQVEVRCAATCGPVQPDIITLGGINSAFCDEVGDCSIGSSCGAIWDGRMYLRGICNWTNGGGTAFGCLFGDPLCGYHLSQAVIQLITAIPPYWELQIDGGGGIPGGSSGGVMWIGRKLVGDTPTGVYTKTGGCASDPSTITVT